MKCIVELFSDDRNGRKMIAWGRRIGCGDAGHVFDPDRRKVATRLLVDDANPSQKSYLLELVDNPAGVKAIVPAEVLEINAGRLPRRMAESLLASII